MPKEGSVAPKERINIVYKPAGDATAEIELPLKLVMLGDYTLRPDSTPLEDRKPIEVDKDNFNKVMMGQDLKVKMTVPNRLSEQEGDEMSVNLKIETLKAFEPESIVKQVPELNKLLELRAALTSLKGPFSKGPEFKKKLQALISDEATRERLLNEIGLGSEGEAASGPEAGKNPAGAKE